MSLTGKNIAILAEDNYQELELWYPLLRLREAGAEVKVIGTGSAETYTSKRGYPVTVDAAADEVKAAHFDAVIVPGGYAPDRLRRYEAVLKLVREAHEQGKVVAAICHAGWVLVSAGILKGRQVTCVGAIQGRRHQRGRDLSGPGGRARWQPHHFARPYRSACLLPHHHRGP